MKESKKILKSILDKLLVNTETPNIKGLEQEVKDISEMKLLTILNSLIKTIDDVKPDEVKEESEKDGEITNCEIFNLGKMNTTTLKIIKMYIDIIKESKKSLSNK